MNIYNKNILDKFSEHLSKRYKSSSVKRWMSEAKRSVKENNIDFRHNREVPVPKYDKKNHGTRNNLARKFNLFLENYFKDEKINKTKKKKTHNEKNEKKNGKKSRNNIKCLDISASKLIKNLKERYCSKKN